MTRTAKATAGVLVFLGISALGGGGAMLAGATPPDNWLDRIPLIDTWTLPGLVLGIGFGLGSLLTGYAMWRQRQWSWIATSLIGLGLLGWISLELAYLPQWSALQAVYGAVGVVLVVLPLLARSLERRPVGEP